MVKHTQVVKNLVLIGASAGGLEPLQDIVGALPDNLSQTSLIIAQHTSPNYESMLAKILMKHTQLEVLEAAHEMKLKANTIYTCPPETDVKVAKGSFVFIKPNIIGPKPSIDALFISVAQAYKELAIGIIVSGTGNDGTKGIIEIKKCGGFTMAQDPDSAKYSSMPDSAILTEMVDLIRIPRKIGNEIPKLLNLEYRKSILNDNKLGPEQTEQLQSVKKILELLHKRTGTDFSGYKASTIHRRLEKRIRDKKYNSVEEYVKDVEQNPEELEKLFNYLLIGVTQFFRNPESIFALKEAIKISLANHSAGKGYRVWVPACATGEEAYTVAMLIDRLIQEGSPEPSSIQVFATDIDQNPLNKARIGRYSKKVVSTMPEDYLNEYFSYHDGYYHVVPELKKNVLFSKHDITSNPPFLKLNLLSCRNLLIYFKSQLQNQIIPLFHYTLEQDGLLFLGKSETIGKFKNLFDTVDLKHRIYRRKNTETKLMHIPVLQPLARPKTQKTDSNLLNQTLSVPELVKETFYNGYAHPYIVVDEDLNILEINKDVSFFLALRPGAPNFTANKLIHKDLALDLRILLGQAHSSLSTVFGNYRKISRGEDSRNVRLKVQPLLYSRPSSPYFVVSFETNELLELPAVDIQSADNESRDVQIAELEHELGTTKEHLNTLIEELETSNEELQSLNEELQSSNEELQASNEELETSNEELQATNEELNVAYNNLREASVRIEQETLKTKKSENNLKSLLDNTQQGFMLVNKDYRIVLFNACAYQLFKDIFQVNISVDTHYIDILPGEYLADFKSHFSKALMGKQTDGELKITDRKGDSRFLSINYTPVESSSNSEIDMVTISLIDITDERRYELKLKQSHRQAEQEKQRWEKIFEDSPEPMAILSGETYTISYFNKSFKALFPKRKIEGRNVLKILTDRKQYNFLDYMNEARRNNKAVKQKEVKVDLKYVGVRYFDLTYTPIRGTNSIPNIILHAVDVTHLVKKRVKQEQEKQFMKLISDNIPEHVWVLSPEAKVKFVNESGLKFFGVRNIRSINTLIKHIHEDERGKFKQQLQQALKSKSEFNMEYRVMAKNGDYHWHLLQVRPMLDPEGELLRLVASSTDIDDRKRTEKRKDEFIGVASHELKTPLTSVKGYMQLLQEKLKNSDDAMISTYLTRAVQSIVKLEKFVSDLLDATRIQNGKLTIEPTVFDLTEKINSLIEELQPTIKTHRLHMETSRKSMVRADEDRIEQVLINLISNAVKFSPEADEIIININHKIDSVEVSIQDFGIGISSKQLESIFQRFYRIKDHSRKIAGLGIGLNISKEIIELHQGQIWAESNPGAGSIFYFSLPLNND